MSARDDLVAAMEALRKAVDPFASRLGNGDVMLTMPRGSAKALLALLDAEPVAEVVEVGGSIAAVRWRGDSLPVETPLYARPEAK